MPGKHSSVRAVRGARTTMFATLTAIVAVAPLRAQRLTTPEQFFGHEIGADYVLPNYTQLYDYWAKLATESPRMTLRSIGKTAEGRDQLMAIVTSPENHENLRRYRDIAARLASAEGVTEEEAHRLAREGKAVVWIDGGLHATEVLGAQQLMETLWQMVSGDDDETRRILDDVIILFVHANPDGMELVSDWYMRNEEPTERSTGGIPRLYQKYVGHDNNRDFFASFQPETENMNRILYREWYPQIVYNHHQTGPTGTVLFAPPFRDPANYNIDPLVITELDLVGAAMHSRFVAEGKPGATRRRGSNYSTWWNGGLRTTPYFKNMIGLLTESIGNPTPIEIPMIMERILPNEDLPDPIEPQQVWHFRQSVDYSVTANKAVLDLASRYRETFLFNIWRMGMNSIEKGNGDTWTIHPKLVEGLREEMNAGPAEQDFAQNVGGFGGTRGTREDYEKMFRPENRDPRGYILPADQPDFPTATKFVNALLENGVHVDRATSDFSVGGKTYPAGSYVVKTAQAFRPHVLDMFEPQDHPDDFRYPGAPPTPPYDLAGWTLAMQMGVEYDRILDAFDGPFERIEQWNASPPAGTVAAAEGARGFLFSHEANDAFTAINRLEAGGSEVYWLEGPVTAGDTTYPAGTFYVKAGGGTAAQVQAIAADLGLDFTGITETPTGTALRLRAPRIALWDRYGGSSTSGWIRWMLEQFEYADVEVVYAPRLDQGNLDDDFDVIIFPDGALGRDFDTPIGGAPSEAPDAAGRGPGGFGPGRFGGRDPDPESIPEEYRSHLGQVTAAVTGPALKDFVEGGGTIVTIGSSTRLGNGLGLPLEDHLRGASREGYYIPGSLLDVTIDQSARVAAGMPSPLVVSFENNPVFDRGPLSDGSVIPLAWFDRDEPLRSGWAWGQEKLNGGVTMAQARVGDGMLYLFGPLITRRAQPHGTFKFLFNAIALSNAREGQP